MADRPVVELLDELTELLNQIDKAIAEERDEAPADTVISWWLHLSHESEQLRILTGVMSGFGAGLMTGRITEVDGTMVERGGSYRDTYDNSELSVDMLRALRFTPEGNEREPAEIIRFVDSVIGITGSKVRWSKLDTLGLDPDVYRERLWVAGLKVVS